MFKSNPRTAPWDTRPLRFPPLHVIAGSDGDRAEFSGEAAGQEYDELMALPAGKRPLIGGGQGRPAIPVPLHAPDPARDRRDRGMGMRLVLVGAIAAALVGALAAALWRCLD